MLLTLATTLFALSAAPQQGEEHELLWGFEYPHPFQPYARMGLSVAWIPDFNGDGSDDLVIGHSAHDPIVYDGKTQEELARIPSSPSWFNTKWRTWTLYGWASALPDDLDGDGLPDLVLTALHVDKIRAVSSATLFPIWTIDSDLTDRLRVIDDVDADGIDDLIAMTESGTIGVISSGDGSELWRGHFATSVIPLDDWDGDGAGDLLTAEARMGSALPLRLRSGRTGALLATWSPPSGATDWFGHAMAPVGDLDGDGREEVVVSEQSTLRVLRGSDGAVVRQYDTIGHNRDGGMTGLGDLDGDGDPEVLFAGASTGRIWYWSVIAARRYADIATGYMAGAESDLRVARGGDVHRDGSVDVVMGNPDYDSEYDGAVILIGSPAAELTAEIQAAGSSGRVTITGAEPLAQIGLLASRHGPGPYRAQGVDLLLTPPVLRLGVVQVDASGSALAPVWVPPRFAGRRVWIQGVDVATGEVTTMHTIVIG